MSLRNADVILINEAQFFDDLYVCVNDMLKENKKIFVSGLDGDFERKKFGQILDLFPLCDKITKLTSLCSLCKNGEPGIFSMRLNKDKTQMLIGSDNYIPVCRSCYETNAFSAK
jgi:thymidine kinase